MLTRLDVTAVFSKKIFSILSVACLAKREHIRFSLDVSFSKIFISHCQNFELSLELSFLLSILWKIYNNMNM